MPTKILGQATLIDCITWEIGRVNFPVVEASSPQYQAGGQGCQNVFKQQADNDQQAALELAPKAQVLEGRGIQGHYEIQSLRIGISGGFPKVFSTVDAMLFRHNNRNTGNNVIEMSQAFHDIARFERFTDLNVLKYAFNVIQNWNMDALQFYSMVFIFCQQLWQKEMKVAGYQPLLTALGRSKRDLPNTREERPLLAGKG